MQIDINDENFVGPVRGGLDDKDTDDKTNEGYPEVINGIRRIPQEPFLRNTC